MDAERWQQVRNLFESMIEISAEDRPAILDARCGDDHQLRVQLEGLLAAHENVGDDFLNPEVLAETLDSGQGPGVPSIPAGERIGAYRVRERIGRGGMGEVYLASREDDFEQEVAIKVAHLQLSGQREILRFHQERQILANLVHPNTARLLDGGTTEDGRPYLVMEYVQGLPIDQYCDVHECSIDQRLELFLKVCAAVQVAHQSLIAHRDLKPANILVTDDGEPKLLDFGIAKSLGEDDRLRVAATTMTGHRAMTPDYASPEQIRGEPLTTATDVYSLGVVLYVLLTGEWPYRVRSRNLVEISQAIYNQEPVRPSQVVKQLVDSRASDEERRSVLRLVGRIRGDLDSIVLCALQKEPKTRYSMASQLAEDIRREMAGLPIQARQQTWMYRSLKFVRRNWLGVSVLAVVLGLLGGFIDRSLKTKEALTRAEREEKHAKELVQEQRWAAGHRSLESQEWLEAAHYFAKFAASEVQDDDAVQSAMANIQGHIGNVDLLNILPPGQSGRGPFYSPDQRFLVIVRQDSVDFVRARDGKLEATLQHPGIFDARFSDDGEYLIVWGRGCATIWDKDLNPVLEGLVHEQYRSRPRILRETGEIMLVGKDRVHFVDLGSGRPSRVDLHHSGVRGMDLSPNQERLATFSENGSVVVWDLLSERRVFEFRHNSLPGLYAKFAPDGSKLIADSRPTATLQVRDAGTGEALTEMIPYVDSFHDLRFGFWENEVYVAFKLLPAAAEVWAIGPASVRQVELAGSQSFWGGQISLSGHKLILSKSDALTLFDMRSGEQIVGREFDGLSATSLRMKDVGDWLIRAQNNVVYVFDSESLAPVRPPIQLNHLAQDVEVSRDRRLISIGSLGQGFRIWDSEQAVHYTSRLVQPGEFERLEFSEDNCGLTTWSRGDLRVWNLDSTFPSEESIARADRGQSFHDVRFASQLGRVVSLDYSGSIKLWSTDGSSLLEASHLGEGMRAFSLEDNDEIILGKAGGRFQLWRTSNGEPLTRQMEHPDLRDVLVNSNQGLSYSEDGVVKSWSLEDGEEAAPAVRVEFEPDGLAMDAGRWLVWGGSGKQRNGYPAELFVEAWEFGSDQPLRIWKHDNTQESIGRIQGATLLRSGRMAFFWSRSGLTSWDLDSGEIKLHKVEGFSGISGRVTASGDNEMLAIKASKQVYFWRAADLGLAATSLENVDFVQLTQIGPTNETALIGAQGGAYQVYDLVDGSLISELPYHSLRSEAQMSQDGQRILTWQLDGRVRLWRSADGTPVGQTLRHRLAEGEELRSAELSEDGQSIISWSPNRISVWDISVDYDFPTEHLQLMVEARTGTTLDTLGRAVPLSQEAWRVRRLHYLKIAEEHSKVCKFPKANLYLHSCKPKPGGSNPEPDVESGKAIGYAGAMHSVY